MTAIDLRKRPGKAAMGEDRAAIMDAAKTGRLGSLAITSEFLAAVGQK